MYQPIRVIIADDHELLRSGFHVLLRKQADIEIVGEAENGSDVLEKVKQLDPDIVIMDVQMPEMDGIEATRRLTELYPHIGVLALTMYNDDNLIVDMLEAGAKGYLLKNTDGRELSEAIKAVHNGGTYFCGATLNKIARMATKSQLGSRRKVKMPEFSEKEIAVMRYICEELQNKEIAEKMGVSSRTVEGYRESIFEKTGAKHVAGIVIYAIRNGYYKV